MKESEKHTGKQHSVKKKQQKKGVVTEHRRISDLKKISTWKKISKDFIQSFKQKEAIGLLVLLVAIVFFFLHFSTHRIDGQSMEPTFKTNDRILIARNSEPSRYAIITFKPQYTKDKSYVKRIIGMPGDRIQLIDNTLFLLPKENEGKKQGDLTKNSTDGTIKIVVTEIVMKRLRQYDRIPANQYFVQGDNRLHSDDSRVFGLIDKAQIEGVVLYRYYPFTKLGNVH